MVIRSLQEASQLSLASEPAFTKSLPQLANATSSLKVLTSYSATRVMAAAAQPLSNSAIRRFLTSPSTHFSTPKTVDILRAPVSVEINPFPEAPIAKSFFYHCDFDPHLLETVKKLAPTGPLSLFLSSSPQLPRKMSEILFLYSGEELGTFLLEVCKNGDRSLSSLMDRTRIIETVLKYPESFQAIPTPLFINIFWEASFRGLAPIVTSLLGSNRSSEIPGDLIGLALSYTADHGHLATANALIGSGRFQDISTHSIGWALSVGAHRAHLGIVNALIGSGRFQEISKEHKLLAYKWGKRTRTPAICKALASTGCFIKIN
jgi:hypothetical protein